MKLSHREKLRKAKKMMGRDEIINHASPFLSKGWSIRKLAKWNKEAKKCKRVSEAIK